MINLEILNTNNFNNEIEIDDTFKNAAEYTIKSRIWAEGSDEQVEALKGEHSSKVWAKEARQKAEEANNSAQLSQNFSDIAQTSAVSAKNNAEILEEKLNNYTSLIKFGAKWVYFTENDWGQEGNNYYLQIDGKSVVFDIYRKCGDGREKIFNCDTFVTDNGVKITSPEAFEGYAVVAANTIGEYVFEILTPQSEWLIEHNLGKYPSVSLADNNGNVFWGNVQYLDLNTIKITFKKAVTGKAYLN